MAASCNEFPDSTKHGEISRRLKELLKLSFSSCCTESNVPKNVMISLAWGQFTFFFRDIICLFSFIFAVELRNWGTVIGTLGCHNM